MDWTELSNRLADGAHVYKVFQDGADAASKMAGLERSYAELSAQFEALVAQIAQAKTDLQTAQGEATRTRIASSQEMARQQAMWETSHAKQVEASQAKLAEWQSKIDEQGRTSQKQTEWYEAQIAQWEGALKKLQDQVASLEQIKASLKSQLQGVV